MFLEGVLVVGAEDSKFSKRNATFKFEQFRQNHEINITVESNEFESLCWGKFSHRR